MSKGYHDDETKSVNRRTILNQSSLAVGAIAGVAGVSGTARGEYIDVDRRNSYTVGNPGSSDKWNAMHIDVIGLNGPPSANKDYAFRGVLEGVDQLYDKLGWMSGYKIRRFELDYSIDDCGDRLSEMADALDEASGFDDRNRLYHFLIGCERLPSIQGTQSPRRGWIVPWGEHDGDLRAISSIGNANAAYGENEFKVRSFHQALHMFIDGDIAKSISGKSNAYEAQHTLGTIVDGERTVMADRNGYEDEAQEGDRCAADLSWWESSDWPDMDDLKFSSCTVDALYRSATDQL